MYIFHVIDIIYGSPWQVLAIKPKPNQVNWSPNIIQLLSSMHLKQVLSNFADNHWPQWVNRQLPKTRPK